MKSHITELMKDQAETLIIEGAEAMTTELMESPKGAISVSVHFKLSKVATKLFCASALTYSRKTRYEDEGSAEVPDPNQPELEVKDGKMRCVASFGPKEAELIKAAIDKMEAKR